MCMDTLDVISHVQNIESSRGQPNVSVAGHCSKSVSTTTYVISVESILIITLTLL